MRFGEVRVDDAEGLILAHSLRLPDAMLKKGRVLTAADVRALKAADINFVTGARLEESDIGENEAAQLLAEALAGPGVTVGPAFSGRCNLFADERGVVALDRDRLDRLNSVDEAVTVATVQPFDVASRRQMIATIKIIPFGVDRRVVDACIAFASTGGALVAVRPFQPKKAVLILTTLPGLKDSVVEAAAEVTRARVEALGGSVIQEVRCPHDVGSLERALIKATVSGCDLILIAGGSATVDRRDTVPAAMERAGGKVDHFGMPVDPGNLLLLGHLGAIPVVNLPGCGRSPKPNGLDWVLRRIVADIPIKPRDIMRMGAGGLLKEAGVRAPGTALPGLQPSLVPGQPRIAAMIMAHMAPREVLADLRGKPKIGRLVEDALKAGLTPVTVVTGDQADLVEEAVPACDVMVVRDARQPSAAGIATFPTDIEAVVLLPAHQDRVSPIHLAEMVRAFDPDEGRAIVVTARKGKRQGPILVGRDLFGALSEAPEPADLLADHAEMVFELVTDDESDG